MQIKGIWSFPLRSSLFFMWRGKPLSTWAALARGWAGGVSSGMVAKMTEYNANFLTYYVFHAGDRDCVVNPFAGCPTAKQVTDRGGWQVDTAEATRWTAILSPGQLPSIYLGPTLFCGDDRATTNNVTFHRYFVPAVVQYLRPYSKFICTGSELPKTMNRAQRQNLVNLVKESIDADNARLIRLGHGVPAPFPVVEHLQGDEVRDVCDGTDAVLYQFSFHPKHGHEKSVQEISREFQAAQSKCRVPLLAFELTLWCETPRAREQARAISTLPGCLMVPGPV